MFEFSGSIPIETSIFLLMTVSLMCSSKKKKRNNSSVDLNSTKLHRERKLPILQSHRRASNTILHLRINVLLMEVLFPNGISSGGSSYSLIRI